MSSIEYSESHDSFIIVNKLVYGMNHNISGDCRLNGENYTKFTILMKFPNFNTHKFLIRFNY